jgi:hypothetical protein
MVLRTQQTCHPQGGLVDQCDEFLSRECWFFPSENEELSDEHGEVSHGKSVGKITWRSIADGESW